MRALAGEAVGPVCPQSVPRKPARSLWREGTLDQIILGMVKACLDENGGCVRGTARDLGISHTTVMRILRKGAAS